MKVFTIWAEWDLGINDCIYAKEETAKAELEAALEEIAEISYDDAIQECLAGIEERVVIE